MHRRTYDMCVVADESRGRGGARQNLVGERGDTVVLPRFRPLDG